MRRTSWADRLRYALDNTLARGPAAMIAWLALASAAVILLISLIVWSAGAAPGLGFHYTPKHASWLNMAEIELSAFTRQCLGQRMGEEEALVHQVRALEQERNHKQAKVDWQFRTENARIKLKALYPSISP